MKPKYIISLIVVLFAIISTDGKRISKSRSSGRGSSKKTNSNPQPTSLSYPQPAAPKPSLFGWQEKPAQRTQSSSRQSQPSNSHSYPSSHTGLSGNSPPKPSTHQESIQKSNVPQNLAGQQTPPRTAAQPQTNVQNQHAYPSSNGLSGTSGSGAGYPQGSGLSGSGAAAPPPYSAGNHPASNLGNTNNYHPQGQPPPYSSSGAGYPKQQGSGLSGTGAAAPPPYGAGSYPTNNFGNNYHHPQGPPSPYSNNYGGYHGSHNPMYTPQSPGYFGNYGRGYGGGGVSRTGSALTGVGIAGAGIGTVLTGLALWNLARSTGHRHHTVIYDNRGQPVAVAPNNSTEPVVDPILGDLVNCTLTISNGNATEVLAIPCSIATSFTPDADVKDAGVDTNTNDDTKCTVTVVTKAGKEFMTTIPCSMLLSTAAENNVTEPALPYNGTDSVNVTTTSPDDTFNLNQPSALRLSDGVEINNTSLNCTPEPGDVRDPINPCFAITQNITVIPLSVSDKNSIVLSTTPGSA